MNFKKFNFSFFNKLRDPKVTIKAIDMDKFDEMVRSNEMKLLIEPIRKEKDKKRRNQLKDKLPLVTFSGVFESRRKSALIQHSGLICLDIDDIPYTNELKDRLKEEEYVLYCCKSPSGNGLKVIIKIEATNDAEHLLFFKALELHFKKMKITIDKACSDVSRACFVTYDATAFYNIEATTLTFDWLKTYYPIENTKIGKEKVKMKGGKTTTKKVNSKIINKAVKRFLKAKDGEKHNTLLNQSTHLSYYVEKGVLENEDCFNALKDAVEKRKDEIDNVDEAIKTIKKGLAYGKEHPKPINNTYDTFWFIDEDDKIVITVTSFYIYLNKNGFWIYKYDDVRKLVHIKNNIAQIVSKEDIIEFVMKTIDNQDDKLRFKLEEAFRKKMSYFLSENQLSAMKILKNTFLRDTTNSSFLCYKNCILEVKKDTVNKLNYEAINGLVWKTSIIGRNYNPTTQQIADYEDKGDFSLFIKGVSGERQSDKQLSRYLPLRTILGYILHDFKDPKFSKSIIFCDEEISDNPNGGTGKGIVLKALQYFKKVTVIDGKNFSFGKTFAFQQVDLDTKILAFDDVKMLFDFNKLFSIITEGIAVEKKNKDTMYIPYKDSPKVFITTNYMVVGEGNSNDRRRVELEFSQHYNATHTPYDEFGKTLFDDWKSEQWQYFDLFMVNCIQLFLKNGVIEPKAINIPLRKLRQATSSEFAVFSQNKLSLLDKNGKEFKVKTILHRFMDDYEDYENYRWFTQKRFNKWLKQYGTFFGYTTEFRYSNNVQYVSYNQKES